MRFSTFYIPSFVLPSVALLYGRHATILGCADPPAERGTSAAHAQWCPPCCRTAAAAAAAAAATGRACFAVQLRRRLARPVSVVAHSCTAARERRLRAVADHLRAVCQRARWRWCRQSSNSPLSLWELPLFPNKSSPLRLRLDIAGLLEITSTLFPLEAALLVALAAGGIAAAEDRARAGVALALTSAFSLAAFGLAATSGLEFEQPAAVGSALALIAATAALGGRAATVSVAEPAALVKRDFEGLLPFGAGEAPADDADDKLAFFYRSSTLTGLLVGASFIFSPLSPIALFDTPEAPATHLFRQELGIYICFLLAPVQTALYRAAQAGELGEQTLKLLNLVAGVVVELLVLDGRAQVNLGTANFAALDKSDPFYAVLVGKLADPDAVGRASTNTTAAFSVGLLVGLVYLATALIKKPKTA